MRFSKEMSKFLTTKKAKSFFLQQGYVIPEKGGSDNYEQVFHYVIVC